MELSERKKRILKAVIELYIATGEPVGSKNVQAVFPEEVSSATIRSEMAALEEMGFLTQPHTSAGRAPSVEGYRYFLKNLMMPAALAEDDRKKIDGMVKEMTANIPALPKRIVTAAAELTGCAAVNVSSVKTAPISRFETIAAAKNMTALLAVNSAGTVKTKIVMNFSDITAESAAVFTRILNTQMSLSAPESIKKSTFETVEREVRKYCPEMMIMMPAVREAIDELKGYDVAVSGETKVFSYPEFSDISKARAFINMLNEEEKITRLALDLPEGINIDIVTDSSLLPAEGMSVISTAYKVGDLTSVLCVFGPKRMNYADIKPKLGYFTGAVNDMISRSFFEENASDGKPKLTDAFEKDDN